MKDLSKQQLYDILERMSDGIVALDKNWNYIYVNKLGAEMLGRKPEDLIGKHIWTEFPEGIDQPFYKAYHNAMEKQINIRIEEYYPPGTDGLKTEFTHHRMVLPYFTRI